MNQELNHFSLCSGIGGIDIAAEWAGFRTVAQCEIDEYASKVLAKNFKGVPNLHDIRTVTNGRLRECGIAPEGITVISAGFPCQPYSLAGKGRGDRDERDLWGEVVRVLGEVRPRWFVGENTPGLFARENQRYFRRILCDLAALGYRVGWGIWGAYEVGAPHKRERVFLVAHTHGEGRRVLGTDERTACGKVGESEAKTPFGAGSSCGSPRGGELQKSREWARNLCETLSHAAGDELGVHGSADEAQEAARARSDQRGRAEGNAGGEWWEAEPDVGRVAHGVSARVDRLRCLGNAVVPYQALPIFEAIAEYERSRLDGGNI